jgi:hypothetical protein
MTRRGMRMIRFAAVAVVAVTAAGCRTLFGAYDIAPNGLAVHDDRLRQMLVRGQAAGALERLERAAPDDEVLRALYRGVLAYHAGEYAESARVLDRAAELADDRVTKSLSRAALSLASNDLILLYEPGRTERLMIPYYAALARLRMADLEGAAVEARRLSLLLQHYGDRNEFVDRSLHATLRYLAGAIFEAAGERNDADVAYRNALALDSTLALPGDPLAAADSGTVLVILEQGFVAHRVEQALAVLLLPEEVEAIAHGAAEHRVAASTFVASRVVEHAALAPALTAAAPAMLYVPAPTHSVVPRTRTRTVCTTTTVAAEAVADSAREGQPRTVADRHVRECVEREEEIEGLPYLLKVAWPAYRADYRPTRRARLTVADETVSFGTTADLSRGVIAEFESERALIVARTIARGTAKLALTKGAERSIEDKSEVAGMLVGLIGNIGSLLLERADTRSWHLLPAGLSVARVRLPAGDHELSIDLGNIGTDGAMPGQPVTVEAGRITILPVRTW